MDMIGHEHHILGKAKQEGKKKLPYSRVDSWRRIVAKAVQHIISVFFRIGQDCSKLLISNIPDMAKSVRARSRNGHPSKRQKLQCTRVSRTPNAHKPSFSRHTGRYPFGSLQDQRQRA